MTNSIRMTNFTGGDLGTGQLGFQRAEQLARGLKKRAAEQVFRLTAAQLLKTAPLPAGNTPVTVLSMLSRRDLIPYLGAIKSLGRFLSPQRIIILNDGTLKPTDVATLNFHVPAAQIVEIATVPLGRCPNGGTWERLCLIAQLCKDSYVVQMDSDTLTLREPTEVMKMIDLGSPFTLKGDVGGPEIVTVRHASEFARTKPRGQLQVEAEVALAQAFGSETKYVRGCSAFAGFPRRSISLAHVESWHDAMHRELGATWLKWGSEQITSNLLIANLPGAAVLPDDRYASHIPTPGYQFKDHTFLHFVGSNRFDGGLYRSTVRAVVNELLAR